MQRIFIGSRENLFQTPTQALNRPESTASFSSLNILAGVEIEDHKAGDDDDLAALQAVINPQPKKPQLQREQSRRPKDIKQTRTWMHGLFSSVIETPLKCTDICFAVIIC